MNLLVSVMRSTAALHLLFCVHYALVCDLASTKRMTGEQRAHPLDVALELVGTRYGVVADPASWSDLASPPAVLDNASFICRVAAEAGVYRPGLLVPQPRWLVKHLVPTLSPTVGDIVVYARRPLVDENFTVVFHVMMYAGNGQVVGACDLAGQVTIRAIDYEPTYGDRQWHLIPPPSFRVLRAIF